MIHLNEQTGAFGPEALHILGGAMDEAWRRVKLTHLNGSANAARSVLAEHIFAMARQGERDPQRLIEGALIGSHSEPSDMQSTLAASKLEPIRDMGTVQNCSIQKASELDPASIRKMTTS